MLLYNLLIYFMLSILIAILMHYIMKVLFLRRQSKKERFRQKKIEDIFRKLNRIEYLNNNVDQKELIRMLHEYSMITNDFENGKRTLKRIGKMAKNDTTIGVLNRAKELLAERLILNQKDNSKKRNTISSNISHQMH